MTIHEIAKALENLLRPSLATPEQRIALIEKVLKAVQIGGALDDARQSARVRGVVRRRIPRDDGRRQPVGVLMNRFPELAYAIARYHSPAEARHRARLAIIMMAALAACGAAPIVAPPVPIKVITVPTIVRCAKEAPPTWHPVGAPTECAPSMACFTREQFATLLADLGDLIAWRRATWTLCAPEAK